MQFRKSIILPIAAILSGVLLQVKLLGFIGQSIPDSVIYKLWPALLIVAALDLLLEQRRVVGALVLLFTAGALLSTQFMEAGWNSDLWQIFVKFWPLLLILFGVDIIFSGRSVINIIVLVVAVILLVYVLLAALNVPVIRQLPIDLSGITSFLPTPIPNGSGGVVMFPSPGTVQEPSGNAGQAASPITYSGGKLSVSAPSQNNVRLVLNAASGRISLKAGTSGKFLDGTVDLDKKEQLAYDASLNGNTALYSLKSTGSGSGADSSVWDLSMTRDRSVDLDLTLAAGYVKADLRGLNLSSVRIENKFGPVDVMVPYSGGSITLNAGSGNIRLYVPGSVRVSCSVTGAANVEYPQRNYAMNGTVITPRSASQNVIRVEIISNGGNVQIIESE